MKVLGIAGQVHDASAALVVDGEIVAAAAEERFTRRKHIGLWELGGLPSASIDFCMKKGGLQPSTITDVAYFMNPGLEFRQRIRLQLLRAARDPGYFLKRIRMALRTLWGHRRTLSSLARLFPCARLHLVDHHAAHASSAFLCSGFASAACLTLDHNGEQSATRLTHYRSDGTQTIVLDIPFPHSFGFLYASFTKYLGFTPGADEFKVMGLASYGRPAFRPFFAAAMPIMEDGTYRLNEELVSPGWGGCHLSPAAIRELGGPRSRADPLERRHADIAASLQWVVEDRAVQLARFLGQRTGERRLVMAGGVALNCAMNSAIARGSDFDDIFIQPAAGDDGTSLGAALYVGATANRVPFSFEHAYWGPEYDDEEVFLALRGCDLPTCDLPEQVRAAAVARLLSRGVVVGLFSGRMEWGPRALGNRSILADPRCPDMKDRLNRKIKFREDFRPFAPAVLEEDCEDYFELPVGKVSPYMLLLARIRQEARSKIPAVVHVDGTARVQTVQRRTNPLLWEILSAFKSITGVPVLLNTSFNLAGEPIVCSPVDAVRTFNRSAIDALVIGGFLVARNEALLKDL